MSINKKLDPRVKRTHQLLREALIALMCEKGYDAITVQDIAQRATLNRATFYLHFRDKEDLLQQTIDDILNDLSSGMTSVAIAEKEDEPHPDLIYIFEHVSRNSDFYKVMLGKNGLPGFMFRLSDMISRRLHEKIAARQPDENQLKVAKDIFTSYVTWAYLGVIVWWLENDMPYTPKYMATQLTLLRIQHRRLLFGEHKEQMP
ncbi:TetR family transcriptional regulator [Collibacillus ludicampi]|jgi:AcrR family transcriptional regulator|uniref:TetR family transcriptional regulator n=1 Tax=Collibacillus ludicampi TaxID=2771369 RepID=A0AAV4LD71_9BACL|nr:TetR/AcrR family transcriptional regulator [Collibacillus ludicampi]GIM45770.1 TetR family transcriptional regulator [Collibacillus ludicampi]